MSRLTELINIDGMKIKTSKERPLSNQGLGDILWKLYEVENLMEKYEIKDLKELKRILKSYYEYDECWEFNQVD